jgi:hypothetical protein
LGNLERAFQEEEEEEDEKKSCASSIIPKSEKPMLEKKEKHSPSEANLRK